MWMLPALISPRWIFYYSLPRCCDASCSTDFCQTAQPGLHTNIISLSVFVSVAVRLSAWGRVLMHPNGFHACQFNHLCVWVPALLAWSDLAMSCLYTALYLCVVSTIWMWYSCWKLKNNFINGTFIFVVGSSKDVICFRCILAFSIRGHCSFHKLNQWLWSVVSLVPFSLAVIIIVGI